MAKVAPIISSTGEAPAASPVPQLTERLRSLDQLGHTTGRFGYRTWGSGSAYFGLRAGDVVKIDLCVPPRPIRGELVWVEIQDNSLETMGVLEGWSRTLVEVWTGPGQCERGSTAHCLPRRVVGKLDLESSRRAFLARWWNDRDIDDAEARQRLNEVLKARPSGMMNTLPAAPSLLTWLLAQPTRGRLLDLTPELTRLKSCKMVPKTRRA
jgi:hypothetical protein